MHAGVRDGARLALGTSMRWSKSSSVAHRHQRSMYVCQECRHGLRARRWQRLELTAASKQFSIYTRARQDEVKRENPSQASTSPTLPTKTGARESNGDNGTIKASKHKELPSRREEIRSRATKYVNKLMDDLMPKLAVASQRINTFTGTDYSGIEALRTEIRLQESLVKERHKALLAAKEALEVARNAESRSRKEVVSLLERRHSWSDTDLERYMSLIRSEHLNDQAVSSAKDLVSASEHSLDEARAKLEKMERMQYHEEQIWSDTIRRNSTWVTFGLMGVNILLLLVTMGVVEPWRRKRMVREIKSALEEKMAAAATGAAPVLAMAADAPVMRDGMEKKGAEEVLERRGAEKVVEGLGVPGEVAEEASPFKTDIEVDKEMNDLKREFAKDEVLNAAMSGGMSRAPGEVGGLQPAEPQTFKEKASDLFSERVISIRRVDLSTIALEGAAAGALFTAIIMALLKPR